MNERRRIMKTYVLYFDAFAEFEVIIAVGNLAQKGDIIPVAIKNRPYVSEEKQIFLPTKTISEISADDVDVFLIPGGDFNSIIDNLDLKNLIIELDKKKENYWRHLWWCYFLRTFRRTRWTEFHLFCQGL